MTNAHVVDDANTVSVKLTDKREFKAKVARHRQADRCCAWSKSTRRICRRVKIDESDKVRVGEWVLAIGSPYGLDNTVTSGIVSAKARATGDYVPFIQTDVAVNPGNSGGPLINMRGEVIGINSQIYSRSGGFRVCHSRCRLTWRWVADQLKPSAGSSVAGSGWRSAK